MTRTEPGTGTATKGILGAQFSPLLLLCRGFLRRLFRHVEFEWELGVWRSSEILRDTWKNPSLEMGDSQPQSAVGLEKFKKPWNSWDWQESLKDFSAAPVKWLLLTQ